LVTRRASVSDAQLATGGAVSRFNAPPRSVLPVHPLLVALGQGLPITLLVDLIDPNGPRSFEMLEREGIAADAERYRAITAETASTA
jgi:hypothetical protein